MMTMTKTFIDTSREAMREIMLEQRKPRERIASLERERADYLGRIAELEAERRRRDEAAGCLVEIEHGACLITGTDGSRRCIGWR